VREARGVEAEPRAEGQYQVRPAQETGRHRVAARARTARVERMIHRDDVGMAGRIRDGQLQLLRKFHQRGGSAPPLDPRSGVNHGGF